MVDNLEVKFHTNCGVICFAALVLLFNPSTGNSGWRSMRFTEKKKKDS